MPIHLGNVELFRNANSNRPFIDLKQVLGQ
jgi:hypothetical protein